MHATTSSSRRSSRARQTAPFSRIGGSSAALRSTCTRSGSTPYRATSQSRPCTAALITTGTAVQRSPKQPVADPDRTEDVALVPDGERRAGDSPGEATYDVRQIRRRDEDVRSQTPKTGRHAHERRGLAASVADPWCRNTTSTESRAPQPRCGPGPGDRRARRCERLPPRRGRTPRRGRSRRVRHRRGPRPRRRRRRGGHGGDLAPRNRASSAPPPGHHDPPQPLLQPRPQPTLELGDALVEHVDPAEDPTLGVTDVERLHLTRVARGVRQPAGARTSAGSRSSPEACTQAQATSRATGRQLAAGAHRGAVCPRRASRRRPRSRSSDSSTTYLEYHVLEPIARRSPGRRSARGARPPRVRSGSPAACARTSGVPASSVRSGKWSTSKGYHPRSVGRPALVRSWLPCATETAGSPRCSTCIAVWNGSSGPVNGRERRDADGHPLGEVPVLPRSRREVPLEAANDAVATRNGRRGSPSAGPRVATRTRRRRR